MGTVAAPQYVIVLTMRTDALLIKALEQGANNCRTNLRRPAGIPQRSGQSVGVIEVFRALANSGIRPNIETAGDTYDHALVETANGLYKAELIHTQDPQTSLAKAELATLRRAHWWNTKQLLEAFDCATPQKVETRY